MKKMTNKQWEELTIRVDQLTNITMFIAAELSVPPTLVCAVAGEIARRFADAASDQVPKTREERIDFCRQMFAAGLNGELFERND